MLDLIRLLFGPCRHDKLSFPITDSKTGETRVTCTDCGTAFCYDWERMQRVGPPLPLPVLKPDAVTLARERNTPDRSNSLRARTYSHAADQ